MTRNCEACVAWTEEGPGAYYGQCGRWATRTACNHSCDYFVARTAGGLPAELPPIKAIQIGMALKCGDPACGSLNMGATHCRNCGRRWTLI